MCSCALSRVSTLSSSVGRIELLDKPIRDFRSISCRISPARGGLTLPICLAKKRHRRFASRFPCNGLNSGWGRTGCTLFPVVPWIRDTRGGNRMGGTVLFFLKKRGSGSSLDASKTSDRRCWVVESLIVPEEASGAVVEEGVEVPEATMAAESLSVDRVLARVESTNGWRRIRRSLPWRPCESLRIRITDLRSIWLARSMRRRACPIKTGTSERLSGGRGRGLYFYEHSFLRREDKWKWNFERLSQNRAKKRSRRKTLMMEKEWFDCDMVVYLAGIAHVLLDTVLVLLALILPEGLLGSYSDPVTSWERE